MIKLKFIFIIVVLCLYHAFFINHEEKKLTKLWFPNKQQGLRPNNQCKQYRHAPTWGIPLSCWGLPSGHAEVAILFTFALMYFRILNAHLAILLVVLVCSERIISGKHTFLQVIAGCFTGAIYSYLYVKFKYDWISLIAAVCIQVFLLFAWKARSEK